MLILLHLELYNMELLYHFGDALPEHQQTLLGCARIEYGFPMEAMSPSELWAQGWAAALGSPVGCGWHQVSSGTPHQSEPLLSSVLS